MLRMRVEAAAKREMRALGAVRDGAGFDDVAKQAEIGEIESHGSDPAFAFDEVRLPILPIV